MSSRWAKEALRCTVHVDAFRIARVPITNAQYQLFVRSRPSTTKHWEEKDEPPKGLESHPVVNVTWHDAVAYCDLAE